jgi:hypothetical protein
MAAIWQVRIEYETQAPLSPVTLSALTSALASKPGVDAALEESAGARSEATTLIIDATTAGEAIDAAVEAFHQACAAVDILPNRLCQAIVRQAA